MIAQKNRPTLLFLRGLTRVRLEYLDGATADVATVLDAARAAGYRSIMQVSERPPHVAIEGSWEDYGQELVVARAFGLVQHWNYDGDVIDAPPDTQRVEPAMRASGS